MCPNSVYIWSVGKRAQEGSRRVEGNLIKIKQQPAADVPVCSAVLLTKVTLVHVWPSRSAASLLCYAHSRDGFRLEGMKEQKEGWRS